MKILVHLVSGQNLPNYIASKIIDPDKELFLYTKDSFIQMQLLSEIIKNTLNPIEIPAWDFEKIKQQVDTIIKSYPDDELILNFTGGSKIMSQAAFFSFTYHNKNCIYINTQYDEFIFFDNSNNKKPRNAKINIKANIDDFIKLNGHNVEYESKILTQCQKDLINILEKNFYKIGNAILEKAKEYEKLKNASNKHPHCNFIFNNNKYGGSIIKYDGTHSTIKLIVNGKILVDVTDKDFISLDLCFGKWFEYACLWQIEKLNYFDDLKINAHILKSNVTPADRFTDKNEIDILALKGIYPSIFECKSGKIISTHVEKLVTLKQTYIGRYASLFFITYFKIENNEANGILLEKMKDNNIHHITYSQLNEFFKTFFADKSNLK